MMEDLNQKIAEKIVDWRDGSNKGTGPSLEDTVKDIISDVQNNLTDVINNYPLETKVESKGKYLSPPASGHLVCLHGKDYVVKSLDQITGGEEYLLQEAEFNGCKYYNVIASNLIPGGGTGPSGWIREFVDVTSHTSILITDLAVNTGKYTVLKEVTP